MPFTTLSDLIDGLNLVAQSRGISALSPDTQVYNNVDTNYEPVQFVVGYTEPFDPVLPINVLWLVADITSPDYNKLMRRIARSPANGYTHTWVEVTDFATVWEEQVWDVVEPTTQGLTNHSNEVGNPHSTTALDINAVPITGGNLEGPLHTRPDLGDYASTEVVPRSWIEGALNVIRAVNTSIQQAFTNIFSQIDNLRGRVEILELSLLGVRGFLHNQTVASLVWDIQHNMDNANVSVAVFEGNEMILPSAVKIVDGNNTQIVFAVPIVGEAKIIPIVHYA